MTYLDAMKPDDLDRLHRKAIRERGRIRSLLSRARTRRAVLSGGINRRNEPRTARVESISGEHLVISAKNFDQRLSDQIYINFEIDGSQYFFATRQIEARHGSRAVLELPRTVYQTERRNRHRRAAADSVTEAPRVELRLEGGVTQVGRVVDSSKYGLGVELPLDGAALHDSSCVLKFLDGPRGGELAPASVRHSSIPSVASGGWVRLGLCLRKDTSHEKIPIDRRRKIVTKSGGARMREHASLLSAALRSAPNRFSRISNRGEPRDVDVLVETFENQNGQEICAIVDSWGDTTRAATVVIPPAWGRTKETLLPLAATIKETFRRAGKPIVVLRFDGTNRRGESYIEPAHRRPGDEYLGFTFSQASRDIVSVLDFLDRSKKYSASNVVLATFSLASIEGRHVLASRDGNRVAGWVCTVGMADLQSALKTISGGVDYAFGLTRGVRFGHHELVGVVADMDKTGLDALENEMVFLEDAIDEMKRIGVPITWIHGRDDAWMNLERVRTIMSSGDFSRRRLLEVPTGHQLRSSREALATFQLIAEEISEIAVGERIDSALPSLEELPRRGVAERSRRPSLEINLRAFWENYLLGRDSNVGMQLLTATRAYRSMMAEQVDALNIRGGQRLADLGAGNGDFSSHAIALGLASRDVTIHEVDFVSQALRSSDAHTSRGRESSGIIGRVVADLDVSGAFSVPLRSRSYDGVIASLVVSYLGRPLAFLKECHRILKPGGSFVVSTLRRDADFSKLFVEGFAELRATGEARHIAGGDEAQFSRLARNFLNDASKILDLEEEGAFQFWEPEEFSHLVASAGFVDIAPRLLLGDPAQAIAIFCKRPLETE